MSGSGTGFLQARPKYVGFPDERNRFPGSPSPLGEIVEYSPTLNETLICLGIWAFGLLCYTIFLRMSVPVLEGKLSKANERGGLAHVAST